jgi:hypothetical protein
MMDPGLSRRLAQAMFVASPDPDTRQRLIKAAIRASKFTRLPAWAKKFIRDTER